MNYTLNLLEPEKSNINYKISQFPDGQQFLELYEGVLISQPLNSDWGIGRILKNDPKTYVTIYSRFKSFLDLEIIIQAVNILKRIGAHDIRLHIPYFLGARSDRRFTKDGIHYIKEVVSPIINSLGLSEVSVLDPHSDVIEACVNNLNKIDIFPYIKQSLKSIDNRDDARKNLALVSPDAGAYKKIFDIAKEFKIPNIINATKVRDLETGNIKETQVQLPPTFTNDENKNLLIVDDLCDGGRTFIELAKAIRNERFSGNLYLYVTHGVFSKGFDELRNHFDHIFTTDSYDSVDADKDFVTVYSAY